MNYYPFPAQLRTNYNIINQFGQGILSDDGKSIDFEDEFIPLIPLGTKAEINWILGDKIIKSFKGTVYLSSPNLLRLIEIETDDMDKIKELFKINANIPATVIPIENNKNSGTKNASAVNVDILYMSNDTIKLQTTNYIGEDQLLALSANIEFLTLDNAMLKVRQRILLNRMNALLVCDVLSQTKENFVALSTYSARLEKLEENQ